MSFEFGIVPYTKPPSESLWLSSLEEAIDYIGELDEGSKIQFTIRKRLSNTKGEGELYMTYPFTLCHKQSKEAMEKQINRLKELGIQKNLTNNSGSRRRFL